jgi:hypothetical protein
MDCEYDKGGYKIKSGQVVDGAFVGETSRIKRDEGGREVERLVFDATTGRLNRREALGPFGKTDETDYINGMTNWRKTYSYDQSGHLTEWISYDGTGQQQGRILTRRNPDGIMTEESSWGKDGELSYQHTFDPEKAIEHFTTFDEFGRAKLTWTMIAGKLSSFWETPDVLTTQFGEGFSSERDDNGDEATYACHNDGRCDVSHVHYTYLGPRGRNPLSAERRDSDGNLRTAVYYDYEVDSFQNWTHRQVWVWSLDLGQRTLYEIDSRKITYWQK